MMSSPHSSVLQLCLHLPAKSHLHGFYCGSQQNNPVQLSLDQNPLWSRLKLLHPMSYHIAKKMARLKLQYGLSYLNQYSRFDLGHLAWLQECHPHINECRGHQKSSARQNHASRVVNLAHNFHGY